MDNPARCRTTARSLSLGIAHVAMLLPSRDLGLDAPGGDIDSSVPAKELAQMAYRTADMSDRSAPVNLIVGKQRLGEVVEPKMSLSWPKQFSGGDLAEPFL
jgi:hypothetical protein